MGINKTVASILLILILILCFSISWLFFLNSEMLNENTGELNELKTTEILRALNSIPLININEEEIKFSKHGNVIEISEDIISIEYYDEVKTFNHDKDLSDIASGDKVWVEYSYSSEGEINVIRIKKILQVKDVKDYETCYQYGGYVEDCSAPRKCVLGQVTFTERDEDLRQSCVSKNGTWVDEFNECEFISESDCYKMNGEYFECESACRHNPETDTCIMMCVQVCKF